MKKRRLPLFLSDDFMVTQFSHNVRQYILVTFNYWNFTLTDGALRMLIVLYFYDLGYSSLAIASLFIFYELFGVVTNLVGGWFGAKFGLNRTMNIGLGLQILALLMLAAPTQSLSIFWVMLAQALSGIAKDLNKMSAKSAIKTLVPVNEQGALYKWIALLTGSKNALKGAGFFLGGALLSVLGFQYAVLAMAGVLALVYMASLRYLKSDMGRAKNKPKFSELFSKSSKVNKLSAARLLLFGARDVWFVVALPVYLASVFGWEHSAVGGFLAIWIIAYGVVQGFAPKITCSQSKMASTVPDGRVATFWAFMLALVTGVIAFSVTYHWYPEVVIIAGLLIFGAVFAVNSSLHSYLIISYASDDGVSLDVGFYYMANALGRLVGTVLSGWVFGLYGFAACLWVSFIFLVVTGLISLVLPTHSKSQN